MAAAGCGAVVGAHLLSIIRKLDVAAQTNPATGAFSAPQSAPNPAHLLLQQTKCVCLLQTNTR